jgi:hypothetical protein
MINANSMPRKAAKCNHFSANQCMVCHLLIVVGSLFFE